MYRQQTEDLKPTKGYQKVRVRILEITVRDTTR